MRELIKQANVVDEPGLEAFLDKMESAYVDKAVEMAKKGYERLLTKKTDPALQQLQLEMASVLQEPKLLELVEEFIDEVESPRLRRRLTVWKRMIFDKLLTGDPALMKQGQELSDAIMAYPYPLPNNPEGTIADVRHILRTEPDREIRRQAWACTEPLAIELKDKMLDFHAQRNQRAKQLGWANCADFILDQQGTGLKRARTLLETLYRETEDEYRTLLEERAERFGIQEIEPWDTQFLLDGGIDIPEEFFPREGITQRLQQFSEQHGIPMDKLGIRPEYFDIPWNGVCFTVNHPKDVRIVCNPRDGYVYYRVMFHELGHGLHTVLNEQSEPVFWHEPSPSAEGIAETFAYFTREPQWLMELGIPEARVGKVLRALLAPWFFYLRQRGALGLFGFDIYESPDQDLDELLGQIESRITLCRADATPRWTANAWFVGGATWHNYVVADMVASQLHQGMRQHAGPVWANKEAIEFLRERYLAVGDAVSWTDKVKDISGSDLDVKALIADVKEMARV